MAKNYVEDNEGQGFASFDDDGPTDLESLLAGATSSEESDEEDTSSYFGNEMLSSDDDDSASYNYPKESTPVPEPVAPSYTPKYEDPVPSYLSAPKYEAPVSTPTPAVVAPPVVESQPEPQETRSWESVPTPTPSYPTPASIYSTPAPAVPAPVAAPTTRASNRIHLPSESDQIALANKTIRIADAYRALTNEVRTVASQFITSSDEVITDEATLVVKVLNADPMLGTVMKALREAKGLDPVERVFFVIDLRDDVLHSLGGLVSAFTDATFDVNDSKINYARNLVREIDQLESQAVNYVEATESILAAADEENS